MKEKIELSHLNILNTDNHFSSSQNQNINNVNFHESEFYNTTTNMTIDNNIDIINKINGYNKTKVKNKKIKNNSISFFNRTATKMYDCFYSLLNHLYFLSEKNIKIQVRIVYGLLMLFLLSIIIYLKRRNSHIIVDSLTNKNYFLFYVNNIIKSQREIKNQFDEINNHDIIMAANEPLLFMRIYTE